MRELYHRIKSESIKLRNSKIILLHIALPIFGGILLVLYLFLGHKNIVQGINIFFKTSIIIAPIVISIVVSLGISLEEENHFQVLFTSTDSKSKLITSKLILFLILNIVAIAILFVPLLVFIIVNQECFTYVLKSLLYGCIYFFIGNIVIYIIHFWISLKSGLGASVMTGVFESFLIIIINSQEVEKIVLFANTPLELVIKHDYIPWAWSTNLCKSVITQLNKQNISFLTTSLLKVSIFSLFLLLIFCIWFEKWEGRKNY